MAGRDTILLSRSIMIERKYLFIYNFRMYKNGYLLKSFFITHYNNGYLNTISEFQIKFQMLDFGADRLRILECGR